MYYVVIAVVVLCIQSKEAALKFKRPVNAPDTRIVGGDETTIDEIPFQLSFRTEGHHFCGASILNHYHALTAAHCCLAYPWFGLSVASSSADRDAGQVHPVWAVIVHPKYKDYFTDYDACVLRIRNPFQWSSTTEPVKLVPPGFEPVDFKSVIVSGWGSVSEGGVDSQQLLRVSVRIIPRGICNADYGFRITPRMICAGGIGGGKDSCQGDSGGPLYEASTGRLVGIVSWGYGCGYPYFPGVYTDVANPEIHLFITLMSHLYMKDT